MRILRLARTRRCASTPFSADKPIPNLATPDKIKAGSEAATRDLLKFLNDKHLEQHPGDTELGARIASYELAARMQLRAAEVGDFSDESPATRTLYGVDDANKLKAGFARNCLLARRLLERGVRFVQVWSGPSGPTKNWDNHAKSGCRASMRYRMPVPECPGPIT